ncbi:MAG: hypothetical protein PHW24_02980 [Candidatus Moranbacteria bacterium]|nr:hypothetical protein [Candidatus Moranbacteria bacterium]
MKFHKSPFYGYGKEMFVSNKGFFVVALVESKHHGGGRNMCYGPTEYGKLAMELFSELVESVEDVSTATELINDGLNDKTIWAMEFPIARMFVVELGQVDVELARERAMSAGIPEYESYGWIIDHEIYMRYWNNVGVSTEKYTHP